MISKLNVVLNTTGHKQEQILLLITSRHLSAVSKIDTALGNAHYFNKLARPIDTKFYQTTWWLIKQYGNSEHKKAFIKAINNANQNPDFIKP